MSSDEEEVSRTNRTTDPYDPSRYSERVQNQLERIKGEREGYDGVEYDNDLEDLRLFATSDEFADATLENYLGRLRRLTKVLDKPLRECDKDDIRLAIQDYAEQYGRVDEYKKSSKNEYYKAAKAFGEDREVDDLANIELLTVKKDPIDPDEVLSEDEVMQLIEAADGLRDTAMLALCWEVCPRRTYLQSLKLKHYEEKRRRTPRQDYAVLHAPDSEVQGLKDADNTQALTISKGYLDNWIDNHPTGDKEDALFCRLDKSKHFGEHLSKTAVQKIFNKAARNAGIDTDRVYPHAFRHARVTHMKKSDKWDDVDIEHVLHWSEGSNQHRRYSHIEEQEKMDRILQKQGIEPETDSIKEDEAECPRCNNVIPAQAETCPICSLALERKQPRWFRLLKKAAVRDNDFVDHYRNRPVPEFQELTPQAHTQVGKTLIIAALCVLQDPEADNVVEDATDMLDRHKAAENLSEDDAHWILQDLIERETIEQHKELYPEDQLV